jgi:tRNA pseudouridine55 synthase
MFYGPKAAIHSNSSLHDAILLLNKIPGITSFEALKPVKKALGSRKVGHTGTLDKFAGGLLVVLTGKALKLTPYFTNCSKYYEALVRFGSETDTLDPEGLVTAEAPVPSKEAIDLVLERFRGRITQIPPVFSAIHVDGKRASELARSGVSVEMKPRSVTIHELSLCSYEPPFARLKIHCSAGTYIRALARDIAVAAGSRAHLAGLTRSQVGRFSLADAIPLLPEAPNHAGILNALRPVNRCIFDALAIPVCEIDEKTAAAVRQGKNIGENILPFEGSASHAAVFYGGSFIALLEKQPSASRWHYAFVF